MRFPDVPSDITPELDRHNGLIFIACTGLLYFAAPVIFVGVVQAALADKLGTSAMVANLPLSFYLLGALAPPLLSWRLPHRLTRATVMGANLVTATVLGVVALLLFLPVRDEVRIAAVIGQGLLQGFSAFTNQVFQYQCLKRGTTIQGQAWAFKWSFALGPILAVAGSLWAQFVLGGGVSWLPFPYDFGILYLIGCPCLAGISFLSSRYRILAVPETARPPFLHYFRTSISSYLKDRTLVLVWLAFFMWFVVHAALPNLSLYTREVLGVDPKELSGWIMVVRFGATSLAGYALGVITLRWGIRAPLYATMALQAAAILWGWWTPGYLFLFAFGLMGAGELGGAYFPAYVVNISAAAAAPRNMSLLMLASPLSFMLPAAHGALADHFGFQASFALALLAAVTALFLVYKLPSRKAISG